jgi:hypothetical protein
MHFEVFGSTAYPGGHELVLAAAGLEAAAVPAYRPDTDTTAMAANTVTERPIRHAAVPASGLRSPTRGQSSPSELA